MDRLVWANIRERPTRTAAGVFGVALSVVLIVVTRGLVGGMLRSSGERESNVGAEILFQPPGSFGAGVISAPLSLPLAYAPILETIEGVRAVTPVGRYVRSGARGLGFELVEGIALEPGPGYQSYPFITGISIVRGRPPQRGDEIWIDTQRARDHGAGLGATIDIFDRPFTVVGIYQPEMGARIKMPLSSLQRLLGAEDKCSMMLVKTTSAEIQEEVAARIDRRLPGNQILLTRDIPAHYARTLPSLNVFLGAVLGLATTVSGLVVLLTTYTAVTSRTREIGILKSMGASRMFILSVVEKEALVLSALGCGLGIGTGWVVKTLVSAWTSLMVDFEPGSLILAAVITMVAGALGAFYPAWKAAGLDPIEALSYE